MKISEQWLREWITPAEDTHKIASLLTMSGLEVDQLSPVAGEFNGVIVALVVETKQHPEADKLTLCQVNTGEPELVQVVCGASNVRSGLKVALATVGAVLPNGMKIQATRLRGEWSYGMLCSTQELGLAEKSEGIVELEADAPIGMNLREYFQLEDHVFDIELTPNRGDCLSIQGVARELSAKLNLPLNQPEEQCIQIKMPSSVSVKVDAPESCPWYTGRVIANINPEATTPLWIKERLRRSGIRSIHPVVDVTQYVMLELGQPLHAFDCQRIQGGIVVRESVDKEQLTLLDGQTIQINSSLVIADQQQVLALAGVMGGVDSAVVAGTKTIFLESAFFTPFKIQGTARRHGLLTDASYRYERGVDPTLPLRALERATYLIQQIAGGEASEVVSIQQDADWFKTKQVQFRPSQFQRRIGIEINENRMQQILESLGFKLLSKLADQWTLEIPTYRFDISLEEDIVEELIRVEGYDQVPAAPTLAELRPSQIFSLEVVERQVSALLSTLGYKETISYSFVDPALQSLLFPDRQGLNLINPISPELSQMRLSLWPGLLASMLYNLNRQQETIALFECGRVFDLSSGTMEERPMVGGLLTGLKNVFAWGQTEQTIDFYDMKGTLESLFRLLSLDGIQFVPKIHEALHPGQSACLMLNNEVVGWCGALHPRLTQDLELSHDVMMFECQLSALSQPLIKPYRLVSKYPKIQRDLAFLVDEAVCYADIEKEIRAVADLQILKTVHVFDVYIGESIPEGKKSIAISLIIQSEDKTLNDEEIHAFLRAIIESLSTKLGMTLRDGS
jgi:phenylalanyl-tRNA synthetase beta chain